MDQVDPQASSLNPKPQTLNPKTLAQGALRDTEVPCADCARRGVFGTGQELPKRPLKPFSVQGFGFRKVTVQGFMPQALLPRMPPPPSPTLSH